MLTPIANVHRHRLPRPGAVVRIAERLTRSHSFPAKRWLVESYPLSDSADQRYSRGIHTCTLRSLCGRYRVQLSGFWCEEE